MSEERAVVLGEKAICFHWAYRFHPRDYVIILEHTENWYLGMNSSTTETLVKN